MKSLRAAAELLNLAQAAAGVGIWNWDLRNGDTAFNAVYYSLFGLPEGRHNYEEFVALVHPDDRALVDTQWASALATDGHCSAEFRIIRATDGETRWMRAEGQITRDANGVPLRAMGAVYDITGRKESDDALRQSEARERARAQELDAIMNAAPGGLWIARDPECRVITANPEAYRMMGMEPGANCSRSQPNADEKLPYRFLRNGAPVAANDLPMQVATATAAPVRNVELTIESPSGERHDLFGHAAPLYDDGGRVTGAVAALVDVTALKRAQAALEEADRRKDEFLAHAVA